MAEKPADTPSATSAPSSSGQCDRCIFRSPGRTACVAFPWGIPAEMLEGRFDHTQPHPGDGGFRFVPRR